MTSLRVVTTKQADADINAATDHYVAQGNTKAALSFVDTLEEAKALLSKHPHLGSLRFAIELNIAEIRAFTLQRFPYIIFYSLFADTIRIHRVLHTARDIPPRFLEN